MSSAQMLTSAWRVAIFYPIPAFWKRLRYCMTVFGFSAFNDEGLIDTFVESPEMCPGVLRSLLCREFWKVSVCLNKYTLHLGEDK